MSYSSWLEWNLHSVISEIRSYYVSTCHITLITVRTCILTDVSMLSRWSAISKLSVTTIVILQLIIKKLYQICNKAFIIQLLSNSHRWLITSNVDSNCWLYYRREKNLRRWSSITSVFTTLSIDFEYQDAITRDPLDLYKNWKFSSHWKSRIPVIFISFELNINLEILKCGHVWKRILFYSELS